MDEGQSARLRDWRMLQLGLAPFHTCWNFAVSIYHWLRQWPGFPIPARQPGVGPGSPASST
eukprot:46307-Amphidinium_carterae.1